MRLTDEQIMDIKEYLNRSIKITISSLIPRISKHGLDLIDTIEALQQENNGWQERYYELDAGHSRLFKDFCKLQQENERLADETIKLMKENAKNSNKKDELVKVLKQVREAINGYSTCPYCWGVNGHAKGCKFYEVLQNIDALIGGKEAIE